jgi:hypothetical protein
MSRTVSPSSNEPWRVRVTSIWNLARFEVLCRSAASIAAAGAKQTWSQGALRRGTDRRDSPVAGRAYFQWRRLPKDLGPAVGAKASAPAKIAFFGCCASMIYALRPGSPMRYEPIRTRGPSFKVFKI